MLLWEIRNKLSLQWDRICKIIKNLTRLYSENLPKAKNSENDFVIKGIRDGDIMQDEILKSLSKIGYTFYSLECIPITQVSGIIEIHYSFYQLSSVDHLTGNF